MRLIAAGNPRAYKLMRVLVVSWGSDDLRMRLELAGVEIRGRSWTEACETTIENASAYVVTVITVVPNRALALVSAYVADLSGRTAVTHMRLAPRQRAGFDQHVLSALLGASHPRACLLDHAAELRAASEILLEESVSVEISEPVLERASAVWGDAPTA